MDAVRRSGRGLLTVVGVALTVLLGACGNVPTDVSAPADDGAAATDSAGDGGPQDRPGSDAGTGGGEGTAREGTSNEGARSEGLAWVPFGPADPDNPTPSWPVYKAFASGDCARLDAELIGNDMGDFGRVLSAVCAAAVDGEQDQWTVAAAHADADPSALANSCLEPVLDDMVDRALDWHARHPTEVPEVRFVRLPTTTPCAATTGPHSLDGADDARGGGDGATEPVDAVTAPPPPIDEPSADAPSADAPSEETGVSAVSGPTPPAA